MEAFYPIEPSPIPSRVRGGLRRLSLDVTISYIDSGQVVDTRDRHRTV